MQVEVYLARSPRRTGVIPIERLDSLVMGVLKHPEHLPGYATDLLALQQDRRQAWYITLDDTQLLRYSAVASILNNAHQMHHMVHYDLDDPGMVD